MSANATGWVWHNSEAGGNDRMVLLAIADECDHWGHNARPGIDRLVVMTKIDRSTVYRCIERLQQLGELKIDKQGGGRARRTLYSLPKMGLAHPQETVAICDTPALDKPSQNSGDTVAIPSQSHAQKADSLSPSLSQEKNQSSLRSRAARLPVDFSPNETGIGLCRELALDLTEELEAFRDYHGAKGTRMIDWQLAFKTWLRRAAEFRGKSRAGPTPSRNGRNFEAVIQRLGVNDGPDTSTADHQVSQRGLPEGRVEPGALRSLG